MKTKEIRLNLVLAVLLTAVLAGSAFATTPDTFIKVGTKAPNPSDVAWSRITTNDPCQATVPKGHKIFIGMNNTKNEDKTKTWTIEIKIISSTLTNKEKKAMFEDNVQAYNYSHKTIAVKPEGKYEYKVVFKPQPLHERLEFTNKTGKEQTIKLKIVRNEITGCTGMSAQAQDRVKYDMYYGSVNAGGDCAMTEVWLFPHNYSVKGSPAPECNMPPESGSWSYSIVYNDPNGDPRPQGGVKWFCSDCNGLGIEQEFSVEFSMNEGIDDILDWYSYNDETERYEQLLLYTGPMPEFNDITSDANHSGTEYSLPMGPNNPNIEPRLNGISKLVLKSVLELDPNTVNDANNIEVIPAGDVNITSSISMSITDYNNREVTIEFSPPLPVGYCFAVDVSALRTVQDFLVTNGVFPVRSLVGDVTRDGCVNGDDEDEVSLYLGQSVSSGNFHCDINRDGYVNSTDLDHVTNRLGNTVTQCVGTCGDADHPYPAGDADGDCDVDFVDFAAIAENWLVEKYPWPHTF